MWKRSSLLSLVLLLLSVLAPGPVLQADAQDGSASEAADADADRSPLVDTADAGSPLADGVNVAFSVLPVSDGLVLVPRRDARGVRSVEIPLSAEGELSLNGEPVDLGEVRDRLGAARSGLVEEILDLDPAERTRLLAPLAAPGAAVPAAGGDGSQADDPEPSDEAEGAEDDDRPGVVSRSGPRTGLGTRIHVARDEVVGDVLLWDGSAEIDGTVDGDVLIFDGSLRVEGTIRQDATVIGGDIFLGSESVVDGDVKSVGGEVVREPGARVGGAVEESDSNLGNILPEIGRRVREERQVERAEDRVSRASHGWGFGQRLADFGGFLSFLVILALLACLATAAAPRFVDRVGERVATDAVRSGLVGLSILVLLVPVLGIVSAILAVTIVGIPILIVLWVAFVFVGMPALALAFLTGFTAVCQRSGYWLARRFDRPMTSRYAAVVAGMVGVMGLLTLGLLLDTLGSALDFFAGMCLAFGGVVLAVASLVGFGAVVLDLFARWRGRPAGTPPAAPTTPGPEDWTPPVGPPSYSPEVAPPPAPAPPPPEPPRRGPSYGEVPPEPPVPPPPGLPSDDDDPGRRS